MIWLLGVPALITAVCGLGWKLSRDALLRERQLVAVRVKSLEEAIAARDEALQALRQERDGLRRLLELRGADVARLEGELAKCTVPGVVRERLARTLGGDGP